MVDHDAQVCTKVFKLPYSEPIPIIGDNVVEYAKSVHHLLDEFLCLGRCNGVGGLHFDSLCEFSHCYKDVRESTFDFSLMDLPNPAHKLKKAR
jgi:hypothetical protein